MKKSSVETIRARFDADVERFSNLETGQTSTIDAAHCMELLTATAIAATPGARTLCDLGCGAGNYSLKALARRPELAITLVDLSEPMVQRARQRLGPAVAAWHVGDVRNVSLGEQTFDIILAAAVLHHLRTDDEWRSVFTEVRRALRPGGGFWVFDLVSHEQSAVQAEQWQRYGDYLERRGGAAYRDHVFAYVEEEDSPKPLTWQLELLRQVGFTHVDVLHKHGPFAAFGGVLAAG